MKWRTISLIFSREVRDQLRDRRTMFTIAVLPLLLYPLLGMLFFQVAQFTREHPTSVLVLGAASLPAEPRLFDGQQFEPQFLDPQDAKKLKLTVRAALPEEVPPGGVRRYAQQQMESAAFDAVVWFPEEFGADLQKFRHQLLAEGTEGGGEPAVPQPEIFVNMASDKSRMARDRVERVLAAWRAAIVRDNLRQRHVPVAATEPFRLVRTDVARDRLRRAAMWSKILPFVVFIWALTGAFYPAVDLCAGEKERGTLETLLCSPAQRSEIVWGKLLTIMLFSMGTSVLNLLSMGLTGLFVVSRLAVEGGPAVRLNLAPPPLAAVGWLLLALVPLAALFSALALAVAAVARSSKEGQYYLMPLLLVMLPLMLVPLLPTAELDIGTSLIPVAGGMLLLRSLIEGHYVDGLRYAAPALGITLLCCLLAIRWAVDQFNNESVLFREGERWELGLWLRQLVRERTEVPTLHQALLCGVLLLLIRFFASLMLEVPGSWDRFATQTAVTLLAFVASPALLMAVVLTRSPGATLLLRQPRPAALFMAAALAVAIHPAGLTLAEGVKTLYPVGPEAAEQMKAIGRLIAQAPHLGSLLLVLAAVPAVCEELAFRGFILSGLRRIGHKWGAIVGSSLFFGAAHGLLQQSLSASAVGVVIGYVAVQTGSLWPGMLFHAVYNSLSLMMVWGLDETAVAQRWPAWLGAWEGEGPVYHWPVVLASVASAAVLLRWFGSLPFEPTAEERYQEALARGDRADPGGERQEWGMSGSS